MLGALRLGGALVALTVIAMMTGFEPLYWLVYVVVGGAVVGYLWAWLQGRGLETRVEELSIHPQVGQDVSLMVSVKERLGLPRGGLRASLGGDFGSIEEEDFGLMPRGSSTWTVTGVCDRRGWNSLGTLRVISSDPSGLVNLHINAGTSHSILVYPATVKLKRSVLDGHSTGAELGVSGQAIGHSPAVAQVRPYFPGDNLARIHWPTTARLDTLMTKDFEAAGINEVWLYLDLSESAHTASGERSTEELAITIAASMAKGLIEQGHPVGLIAQAEERYRFAPSKDPNHIWAIMGALATARTKGRIALGALLSKETAELGAGAVAMVIAPWPGRSIRGVFQFLTRRGVLVVPIFLDTETFGERRSSRQSDEPKMELLEWGVAVGQGDDLSLVLGNLVDRIASY